MSTLTLLIDSEAAAEDVRKSLVEHGITDADIMIFAGPDCADPMASVLDTLHLDAADREAKTHHVAEGGALVAVRVSDETHDLVKRILEGRPDEAAASAPTATSELDADVADTDGQQARMSSAQ